MDIYDVGVVKIIACDCLATITHNGKMNKRCIVMQNLLCASTLVQ